MSLADKIQQKIEGTLTGATVNVIDETGSHIDHNPGAHLGVAVTYAGFAGKTIVEQHQIIYKILDDEIKNNIIHALKIKTKVT